MPQRPIRVADCRRHGRYRLRKHLLRRSGSGYNPFSIQNGALSITAVPKQGSVNIPGAWQSGLITTQGNFSQTYGYFEIRAISRMIRTPGDAFWLLPNKQSSPTNNDASHQELDIVEHYGNNDAGVYSTIHTDGSSACGHALQDTRQVLQRDAAADGLPHLRITGRRIDHLLRRWP